MLQEAVHSRSQISSGRSMLSMFQLNFCEYNRSNQDYDTIFRPAGNGDYLFFC